jgi:hypothetical protein
MTNADITVLGLVFDIVGVGLLWRFGLPPEVSRGGKSFLILEQTDENEKKKAEKYDCMSYVSLALIVVGFLLQAAGTKLPPDAFGRTPEVSQAPKAKSASPSQPPAPEPTPKP